MKKAPVPFIVLALSLVLFFSLCAPAQAEMDQGYYCSEAVYRGNWGMLVDPFAGSDILCHRIQNNFLYGQYPDQVNQGVYNLRGINEVTAYCERLPPYTTTGIGSTPFFDAYAWAQRSGGRGCLFSGTPY